MISNPLLSLLSDIYIYIYIFDQFSRDSLLMSAGLPAPSFGAQVDTLPAPGALSSGGTLFASATTTTVTTTSSSSSTSSSSNGKKASSVKSEKVQKSNVTMMTSTRGGGFVPPQVMMKRANVSTEDREHMFTKVGKKNG